MQRSALHGILFMSLLAAAGCGPVGAGAGLSHGVWGAPSGLDAGAAGGPVPGRGEFRGERAARPGTGGAWNADAPFIAPAGPADTVNVRPGALLDVWLNDEEQDLRTLSSERSLGTAVVRGDFFRYNTVNSSPDLRGLWGQPLALKWSALLEITERGAHVFLSELSKERGFGAMEVRTLVRVNDETVFEEEVRVFGGNEISETDSRVLTLAPGFYRLEVWLAVDNRLALPPATHLGTFLKIRAPGIMTPEPVQPSRVWHRVR